MDGHRFSSEPCLTIKGILFDLDDTLIGDTQTFETAMASCFRDLGLDLAVDRLAEARADVRKIARKLWLDVPESTYLQSLGFHFLSPLVSDLPGDQPEFTTVRAWIPEFRFGVWRRVLKRSDLGDAAMASQVAQLFPDQLLKAVKPMTGVTELLETLSARFRLGIVTNGPTDLQVGKLHAAGLSGRFAVIAVSGSLGVGKPDPQIFTHALQDLELAANETVMIGDNLVNDIQGGLDAGLTPIWLQTKDQTDTQIPKNVPVVRGAGELLAVIDTLASQAELL